jgi:hypothetical protein
MDSIDITDSAFALDVPSMDGILTTGGDGSIDYTMFIYIGIAIVVAIFGIFIYKYYQNKNSIQEEDCPGGFCTMEKRP